MRLVRSKLLRIIIKLGKDSYTIGTTNKIVVCFRIGFLQVIFCFEHLWQIASHVRYLLLARFELF